jgi:hypothetical protein
MSGPEEGPVAPDPHAPAVPTTGDPAIDDALQGLRDLPSIPLSDHHDRLAQVHEELHAALERSGDEPDSLA